MGGGCVKCDRKQQSVDISVKSAAASKSTDPSLVPRPLNAEERETAWRAANFYSASAGHELPVALWILGPSSVGKSTLTNQVGQQFGIPYEENTSEGRGTLDAVFIDGEFMRDAHGVWQSWIKKPDWRSAYPALKSIINKEKDKMCAEAAANRKHLVIPQTLLNLQKGLDEVETLTWQGYVNYVVAVVAPLVDCERRGRKREVATGKRYQPLEFEQSVSAIPPMIMACNGRYEVVKATERKDSDCKMEYQALSAGQCGHRANHLHTACMPFGEKELQEVIDAAIHNKSLPPLPVDRDDSALGLRVDGGSSPNSPKLLSPTASDERPSSSLEPGRRPRPFTPEECASAWSAANFYTATSSERPVALWIIGPSSVGKSTLLSELCAKFEIPRRRPPVVELSPAGCVGAAAGTSSPQLARARLDAVIVDGDPLRDAYGVWQLWMQSPQRQFAYRALKSTINKEKGKMCTEAVAERKNLVITQSMLNLKSGLTELEELAHHGYTNHIAAVLAPRDWCLQRGHERQTHTGKQYRREDFDRSVAAIAPMISACNGCFKIVRVSSPECGSSLPELATQVLASGRGGVALEGLEQVIEAAVTPEKIAAT